jgi:hypothetical protein
MKNNEYTIIRELQREIKELKDRVKALEKTVAFHEAIRRR